MLDDIPATSTPVHTGSTLLRPIWLAGIPAMLLCALARSVAL